MRLLPSIRPGSIKHLAALLAATGLMAATLSDHVPVLAGLFLLAIALPGFTLTRWRQPHAYRTAWNAATLIIVIGVAIDALLTKPPVTMQLFGLCGVLLLRTAYLPKRSKDYMTIWAISSALLAIGTVRAESPLILLLLVAWGFLTTIFLARLSHSGDRRHARLPLRRRIRTEPPRVARYLPALAILTSLLFFLLPRPDHMQPPWLTHEAIQKNRARLLRSGLGDTVDLTAMTRLQQEPGVALRVRTERPSLRLSNLKFRLGTLDGFSGDQWFRTETPGSPTSQRLLRGVGEPAFVLYHPEDGVLPPSEEFTILLVDFPTEVLPVPEGTLGLRISAPALLLEPDGRMALPPEAAAPYSFSARVALDTTVRPLAGKGEVRDIHLEIPAALDRQQIEELAARIVGNQTEPEAQARAIWTWLRRNGTYTTDLRHLEPGADGVMQFLRHPNGHCELFATSMAMLARARGLPSRLVVGYSPSRVDPEGSEVAVRHADAHAWAEVHLPGTGWTAFDPTPSAPMAPVANRLVFTRLRDAAMATSARLGGLVAGYDGHRQRSLTRAALHRLEGWLASHEQGLLIRTGRRLRENAAREEVAGAAGLLLILNLTLWLVSARLRRRWSRWESRRHQERQRPVPKLLRDLLRALGAHHEIDRLARSETPGELILSLAHRQGLTEAEGGELVQLYSQWRYGGRAEPAAQLRANIRSLKRRKLSHP